MLAEIAKLQRLRAIGLPSDLFADVAPKARQGYRQRVQIEEPYELRRHPEPVRSTLLAAWAGLRSGELTDNLVDTLVQTIERIDTTAQRRVEQELLADFRRVTGKTGLLFRVAEASVERPDGIVRDVVFPAVGGERVLRDLVSEYKATGPGYRRKFHQAMRRSYQSHYRRLLPPLLDTLEQLFPVAESLGELSDRQQRSRQGQRRQNRIDARRIPRQERVNHWCRSAKLTTCGPSTRSTRRWISASLSKSRSCTYSLRPSAYQTTVRSGPLTAMSWTFGSTM